MNKIEQFYEAIKRNETIILASALNNSVTMRNVSPIYYEGNILFFTNSTSRKYEQLKQNPNCCISVNNFFAECTVEFLGATMLEQNEKLREIYCSKFPGAFDENVAFGGKNAEFLLLKPNKLKGWGFANDLQNEDEIPTVPFEISIS